LTYRTISSLSAPGWNHTPLGEELKLERVVLEEEEGKRDLRI
jgi:hypothetical protein